MDSGVFKDPEGVAECTRDEITLAVRRLWPLFYDGPADERDRFTPVVDGHWRVGFSLKLYGPSGLSFRPDQAFAARRRAAWQAMEQLQSALEDLGFESTRDGNDWQDGRLILGWAVAPGGARLMDMPDDHPARVARRERLAAERAARCAVVA